MRVPVISKCEPEKWFGETELRSPELHDLVTVSADTFVEKTILVINRTEVERCSALSTQTPEIGLIYDQICASSVVVANKEKFVPHCVPLITHRPQSGAVPGTLNSALFRGVLSQISAPITDAETPDSAFERIFNRHLSLADKMVIIDPYAGKNLVDPNSVLRGVLERHLFPKKNLQLEIHTKPHPSFWDDTLRPFENFKRAQDELCFELNSFRNSFPSRDAGLKVFLYKGTGSLRDAITFEGLKTKEVKFTHDRHFEFIFFGDKLGSSISDYFTLGNGLDIFLPDDSGAVGIAGAQTYASDSNRVWAWMRGGRRKALLTGVIDIKPELFGNSRGAVSFERIVIK